MPGFFMHAEDIQLCFTVRLWFIACYHTNKKTPEFPPVFLVCRNA